MNRGLARRTVFETRADFRAFLALVARAVREGRIEVVAYALLSTHFHLLVRSLDGRISETLRRIENGYVRRFNRARRRDGPLFRGRFRSIPVESVVYLHTLVRYIDQNPVDARIVTRPEDYPFGSAYHHLRSTKRPRWLSRETMGHLIGPGIAAGVPHDVAYRRAFAPRISPAQRRFVEARLAHPDRGHDALDGLVLGTSDEVFGWMVRKARLADHTKPGLPVADAQAVAVAVAHHRARGPNLIVPTGPRRLRSAFDLLEVALLHDLSGETFTAIARRRRTHLTLVHRLYEEHCAAVLENRDYGALVTRAAVELLEEQHGLRGLDRTLVDLPTRSPVAGP